MVVERALWYKEKKTRFELGREEIVKRIWRWKEEKGGALTNKLKVLGAV
jgi:valyl-tRNA synthetase